MTEPYRLYCPSCRSEQVATAQRCAACGGLLAVGLTRFLRAGDRHPFADVPGLGAMWRSNPVLPIADPNAIVSLGEGGTPCVPAAHLGSDTGVSVWLKNEAANPTGSFKDRQVAVGISRAVDARWACGAGATSPEVAMRLQISRGHEPRAQETQPGLLRRGFRLRGPRSSASVDEVVVARGAAVPHSRGPAARAPGRARPGRLPQLYVVSSGNVAAAAAAYCARAGARLWVIAPASAPAGKLLQVQLCGARVVRVQSPSAGRLFELAEQAAAEFGWWPLSTAARASPFNIVGARTIAAEILEQIPAPDWVIAPVGGGGLLGSLWQGLQDAARLRPGLRMPRLVAVQAAGCAPFVRAVEQGLSAAEALANPWPEARTIAGGLADDIPFDAHLALPAVIESQGLAVAVTDDEIRAAQRLLAESEGLFIEPSGAVTIAALLRAISDGRIASGETVCCLLTGSGLKDPASAGDIPPAPVIAADIEQLREAVKKAA